MNRVKTVFLMTALAGILMAIGGLIGGRSGVMVMFLIATGMNFISYWFSDSMVLKAYRAQEVGEDHYLYRIVADLAQRAELPMPKVYIIPTEVPNAFATGRSPSHAAVAATAGILDLLDEDEIRGVLAHEMSHILHRDILISTIVATFASAIGMIANIAQWAAIFGGGRDDDGDGNPIALLVTAIVAPLAASVIQLGISRTREYMADEEGGRMIDDPIALARALAKIDNYAHHYALPGATKATAHMCIISTIVATFASAIGMIANIAQWAAIFGGGRDDDGDGNPIALLVTAIVAPLAASVIQLGISRTREYMADEEGGRMIDDPIALARALAKIDNYAHHYALPGATKATAHMCIINPFAGAGSAIANLFSTHPPTEQRIERLEELDKELHD